MVVLDHRIRRRSVIARRKAKSLKKMGVKLAAAEKRAACA
jgi:hypothetical protein